MVPKTVMTGLAAVVLLALPALGQDRTGVNLAKPGGGVRGAVSVLALAQDLHALGVARKDALIVLSAARLAASVTLREVERAPTPEIAGAPPDEAAAAAPAAAMPVGAAAMLDVARTLAGEDETVIGLIEAAAATQASTEAASRGAAQPHGDQTDVAQVSRGMIGAGGVDLWQVPFYAGAYAELAVLGDGGADLDLQVTDENGNAVCIEVSWTDRGYCDFTPAWNGYFKVRVTNVGAAMNRYLLLSN